MNKVIKGFAAVALCATLAPSVRADVQSSNVCGYQNIEVIYGWSLFTPTFKNIGENAKIDLQAIVPMTPKGAAISLKDGTVYIKFMDDGGNYYKTYNWQGKTLGNWAEEGKTTSITNGEVMIGEGWGIEVYNGLRVAPTFANHNLAIGN